MARNRLVRIGLTNPRTYLELALLIAVVVLVTRQPAGQQSDTAAWRQNVIYRVPMRQKLVALTYDDGPDPRFTPKILDILDKLHVKATFFMIGGRMEKYPDIVRDVLRRGHVIGNHTYTHPHDIKLDNSAQLIRELDQTEQVIEHFAGHRAHLFRPPRGLMDGIVFMVSEEEGYKTILWSVCADNHNSPTPELMASRVANRIKPGAIVLAHDGRFGTRWKDVAATPLIIQELRHRGYRFVTVPELLKHARKP